jgi:C4-dicarboxylate-specific signal transduction histidine kinase
MSTSTISNSNELKYKRQLELGAEISGVAFWEFDFKTSIFILNEFYYKFLKTSIEVEKSYEIDVKSYFDSFIPKKSQQIVIDIITEAQLKDKDYNTSFEYEMKRRDGKILHVQVDLYVAYDKYGKPDRSYGTKHDISKRKAVEEILKKEKKDIEQKNLLVKKKLKYQEDILVQQSKMASMGEMIGNIAHQWRQPLNTLFLVIQKIKMYSDEDILTKKEIDKAVDKSKILINKMSSTIDDFRNFFKVDKAKKEFDISTAIDNTINLLDGSLKNSNILILKNYKDTNIIFLGFINELEQVLLNIINNAKDALIENSIKNSKINIKITKEQNNINIDIFDNAGGIPEDIKEKIFEPYFTTKEQGKGTGIGLYMSKMIIENNFNGKINVYNINNGANFKIILPFEEKII